MSFPSPDEQYQSIEGTHSILTVIFPGEPGLAGCPLLLLLHLFLNCTSFGTGLNFPCHPLYNPTGSSSGVPYHTSGYWRWRADVKGVMPLALFSSFGVHRKDEGQRVIPASWHLEGHRAAITLLHILLSILVFITAKDDGKNWNFLCEASVKKSPTPTNQHSVYTGWMPFLLPTNISKH